MSTKELRKEFCEPTKGLRSPDYFRYKGYLNSLNEPIPIMRARAIESLFTETKPYIYKNDLIVGSTKGLYTDVSEKLLKNISKTVNEFGKRSFITNCDHYSPSYPHVVNVGITGLLSEIDESEKNHADDDGRLTTLRAMKITLHAFVRMIDNYRLLAISLRDNPDYDREKLSFIEKNCEALTKRRPETFAEALQLIWLCHTAFLLEERYAMALGRMDMYLYPFYKKDIENKTLTKEKATSLLKNVFAKIESSDVVNICIGGTDTDGNCTVNELSYCIIDAVKECNIPGPNLSARISEKTPDEFLLASIDSIGTGLGYPALMSDKINMAALSAYGYEKEDICNYSMVGCIENFITGMQPPWSDGRFDTPRFFDYLLNNGISEFGNTVSIDTGDVEEITDMKEFMNRFEKQLEHGVSHYCAEFEARNNRINQEHFPEPFLSCFCHDCIGRGLDINNGGSRYPSVHGAVLMGVGTVADSLSAVEKVIFTDKKATVSELRDALRCNFEGYEELRELLLDAPKYGNNDDFADKYAVWFLDYLSSLFKNYRTRDGGYIYVAMAANVQNIYAGKQIAATPDGRLQGEPLSDAASPTYGRDVKGATTTLNSVTKPDYTKAACGTVINQKFSPSMFCKENRMKLLSLIKTYFKKGGQEIQINATSKETLLDAMEHPEKHGNLVVRVSGFSDYYVRLAKEVQLDILSRTQH